MPWWEQILFRLGQSAVNQSVTAQYQAQAVAGGAKWLWQALQGDFNKNPTTGQVVTGGIISLIPVVDQLCDVRDVIANCLVLSDAKERENHENWIALGLTCFGLIPLVGSAVKTVAKAAMKKGARLLDLIKQMEWVERLGKAVRVPWGRAPLEWLSKYDWQAAASAASSNAKKAFQNALAKVESAKRWAAGVVKARLEKLAETFQVIISRLDETVKVAAQQLKSKLDALLQKEKAQVGKYDGATGTKASHTQKGVPPRDPRREAAELIAKARKAEPRVTEDLSGLASKTGGKQEGLDYRLKTEESLARKLEGTRPEKIGDALRYTTVYPPDKLGDGAAQTLKELEAKGYTVEKVKNTFVEGAPYKGINTTIRSPDGQPFELQFHTPQSFDVKQNLTHGLYEELRLLPPDSPRAAELTQEIAKLSDAIKIPQGIATKVPNVP
ncbi:hypothetical protein AAW51_0015 [Caldimonas brevitalea]|uniref:Uncharacterized protein n=2 Tax=Caldimonas brevitalea TaxID=413882 RepID=A0A0G3BH47_9BURK|nr:hypothetical protein AAW51_0015 [Caldimonas brevitalea]